MRTLRVGLWAVIGVLLVTQLTIAWRRSVSQDEIEGLHTGWKLLVGERPYHDFFQHHHFTQYYANRLVLETFGASAEVLRPARMAMVPWWLLYYVAVWRLGRRAFGPIEGQLALVLALGIAPLTQRIIEIRPDVPQAALGLLGLTQLIRSDREPTWRDAWLAGLAMGLSLLYLQKAGLMIAAGVVVIGASSWGPWLVNAVVPAWLRSRGPTPPRNAQPVSLRFGTGLIVMGTFLAVSLIPWAGLLAWNAWEGTWSAYWLFQWGINSQFEQRGNPLNLVAELFTAWPILLVAGLGLPPLIRGTLTHPQRGLGLLLSGALVTAALLAARTPYMQYFLPWWPFVTVIAARTIRLGLTSLPPVPASVWHLILGVGSGTLGVLVMTNLAVSRIHRDQLGDDIARLARIEAFVLPNETILADRAEINLARPDADYFWFSTGPGFGRDAARRLGFSARTDAEIVSAERPVLIHRPSPPEIAGFEADYQAVEQTSGGTIHVRRDALPRWESLAR